MSAEQIPQLQRVAAMLQAQGYAVVTIAEPPSPEFSRYMSAKGITFPVYHDVRNELTQALGQWGTPEYYVLDGEGRVRFGPLRELFEVPAQINVVGAPKGRAAP